MSLNDDIALMKKVKLFAGFAEDHLRLLAFGTQRRMLPQGAELFSKNAQSQGGFVVASGEIEFVPEAVGGKQSAPTLAEEGALLGAINMIVAKPYSGKAVALNSAEVLCIPRETFMRMMNEFPELASLVHERLSANVEDTIRQLKPLRSKLS